MAKPSLQIFLNYRHEDTWGEALLLFERLAQRFGAENVFLDTRSLQPGIKWLEEIKSQHDARGVLLALIGPRWTSIAKAREPAEDYVRLEIEYALRRNSGFHVIPVLVGDAVPPAAEELPRSLQALMKIEVEQVRPKRFDEDLTRLIGRLETITHEQQTPVPQPTVPKQQPESGGYTTRSITPSTPAIGGRIFLSYRHEETDWQASWLTDLIADRFGDGTVFKDVDSIQPGDDFIDMITDAVGSCEVLLALIGNQWLTITDRNDQRRLDDPQDFVRLEVEAALNRNVRVIPILVQGARMPRADELPDSLAKLARRQAIELTPRHFKTDAEPLLKVLDKAITKAQTPPAASGAVVAARPEVVVAPRPDAAHFELVINRMAEGNLVTFLGSSGAELAAGLAGKFNIETLRKLSEIAQYIYVTRGRPDLYRALRQILTVKSEPEPVHRFLAGLPRTLEEMSFENRHQLIVNTSFDMALEQAFDEEQEPYDLVVYMASGPDKGRFIHFPFEGNPQPIANPLGYSRLPIGDDGEIKRTVIVKIYGAVDGLMGDYRWRENYVITDDDYINYLSRGPRETLIPVQILDKLTDSHCLFLSYPVHDWGQRVFLDRVWGGKPVGAASWAVEPDPDILTKASWQQFHVDLYLADLTQYIYELQEKITRRINEQ